MKIGVLSDTHDYLDPQVPRLFCGVDHIVHAGDVGLPWLLLQLEAIAPVTAVLGNTDTDIGLRETEVVHLAERKFLVHHIVDPHRLDERLRRRIDRERPAVVVFGHTHRTFCDTIDGVLFFNPGYAGKPRFGLPRRVAILHCHDGVVRPESLAL
jgi:putative phosphoesterase